MNTRAERKAAGQTLRGFWHGTRQTTAKESTVWYTAGTTLGGDHLSRFVITVAGRPPITIPA
jgi:hypothetical protein